ncbi:MAG: DUF4342 domain-containing protein [Oscillospiraceae bacterium]
MKDNLELVEKLVEKTGLSYTEAKNALEKANWDMLDAFIALEAEGKLGGEKKSAQYSTESQEEAKKESKKSTAGEDFKKTTKSIGEWLRDVFDKGNTNFIEMYRNGERKLGMPITVFVLLLIVGFWILIPLMIVGLFFGCSYRFSGAELGRESVNEAMGKATDFADTIKNEFKNGEAAQKNEAEETK